MSENILSLEDLKFLESLYFKHGISFVRCDDSGLSFNKDLTTLEGDALEGSNYLSEISKKLKFRLNSNFQLNFSSGFNLDVVKL